MNWSSPGRPTPAPGRPTPASWTMLFVDVPPGVVTVTVTVPDPDGLTALIWVPESMITSVAASGPNITAVAPMNPLPVIVTGVPPSSDPLPGVTAVTTGTGM